MNLPWLMWCSWCSVLFRMYQPYLRCTAVQRLLFWFWVWCSLTLSFSLSLFFCLCLFVYSNDCDVDLSRISTVQVEGTFRPFFICFVSYFFLALLLFTSVQNNWKRNDRNRIHKYRCATYSNLFLMSIKIRMNRTGVQQTLYYSKSHLKRNSRLFALKLEKLRDSSLFRAERVPTAKHLDYREYTVLRDSSYVMLVCLNRMNHTFPYISQLASMGKRTYAPSWTLITNTKSQSFYFYHNKFLVHLFVIQPVRNILPYKSWTHHRFTFRGVLLSIKTTTKPKIACILRWCTQLNKIFHENKRRIQIIIQMQKKALSVLGIDSKE